MPGQERTFLFQAPTVSSQFMSIPAAQGLPLLCTLVLLAGLCACSAAHPGPTNPDAGGFPDAGAADAGAADAGVLPGDGGCAPPPSRTPFTDATPELGISLPAGPVNSGITDPSLTGFPDGGHALLVFSVADIAILALADGGAFAEFGLVRTQAATPSDQGFTFVANANVYQSLNVFTDGGVALCAGGSGCGAFLVHEVPTVVTDPTDPDPKRFYKLFVHSYLQAISADPASQFHVYPWGFIGMQTAAATATDWSGEEKLLGWTSSLPAVSSGGATQNLSLLDPALADCIAFSEPGAVAYDGTIDLALGCVSNQQVHGGNRQRIVLLRSTDHAASFRYVGQLLGSSDALRLGDVNAAFTGANLFIDRGQEYLSATTEGPLPGTDAGSAHQACYTFAFAPGSHDELARDACRAPTPVREIRSTNGRQSGTCTYFRPLGGYLVDTAVPEDPSRVFRILSLGIADP